MTRTGKDRLGRGLGALLGEYLEPEPDRSDVRAVPCRSISPNPLQPRKEFSPEELADLSQSIRTNGLLQPLVVRPSQRAGSEFELVAGERRLRAINEIGWLEVPVIVRDVDDETLLVLALVENLQREALSPLEEAEGYRTLAETFGMTQAQIARSVGKDRSTVANLLRLLRLPPSIRRLLEKGSLTAGHARALLAVEDTVRASALARRAAKEGWSVREIEARAGDRRPEAALGDRARQGSPDVRDPLLRELEESLREALATRVTIRARGKGKGVIEIAYHDSEDFERLFALIAGVEASEVVS